jgi:tRNA nucleotidyltransferase (CCA-adding enzyme)
VAEEKPRPIVMGRHLIDLGLEPGRQFKGILDACFEAQLDGDFEDLRGGLAFLRRLLAEEGTESPELRTGSRR